MLGDGLPGRNTLLLYDRNDVQAELHPELWYLCSLSTWLCNFEAGHNQVSKLSQPFDAC